MFERDIEQWINEKFPDEIRAKNHLMPLLDIDTQISIPRIIRSVLYLSESDYDSLAKYAVKAAEDPRNVLWWAEYDNRNIQKRDFNETLYNQS